MHLQKLSNFWGAYQNLRKAFYLFFRNKRRAVLDKSVEEDLIAENQRLRMEIEYLKKLSALVLAEEQEKNKKQ